MLVSRDFTGNGYPSVLPTKTCFLWAILEAIVTIPRTDNKKCRLKLIPLKNNWKNEDFKRTHKYFVLNNYITYIWWMGVQLCNNSLLIPYQYTSSKLVEESFLFHEKKLYYHCSDFSNGNLFHRYGSRLINKIIILAILPFSCLMACPKCSHVLMLMTFM